MKAKNAAGLKRRGCCTLPTVFIKVGADQSFPDLEIFIIDRNRRGTPQIRSSTVENNGTFPFNVIAISENQEAVMKTTMKHGHKEELDFLNFMRLALARELRSAQVGFRSADLALAKMILAMNEYWAAQPTVKTALNDKMKTPRHQELHVVRNIDSGKTAAKRANSSAENPGRGVVSDDRFRQLNVCADCTIYGRCAHCMCRATKEATGSAVLAARGVGKDNVPKVELKTAITARRRCERNCTSLHTRGHPGTKRGRFLEALATATSTARDVNGQRTVQECEYQIIPINMIDDNPYRARLSYDARAIEALAKSISENGQLKPGTATKKGNRYVLIDGHDRKEALEMAGIPTMKLWLRGDVGEQDLYGLWFKENVERHSPGPMDNALSWSILLSKGVYLRNTDIAKAIGVSTATVSKTLALLKASPDLIAFACEHFTVNLSVLYELYQLELALGSRIALEMGHKFIKGEATRNDITRLRRH
jgi:ParB/RepB/Spo0J family partition protein